MRSLIRAVLVIALIAIVGMFLFGYWTGSSWRPSSASTSAPVATTGTIDTSKARERGAEIGEKTAVAVEKVKETVAETQITGKIKAKMALDDMIKARSIDVSTTDTTVTLSGTVGSKVEHDRAMALARETSGVTRVVDGLRISR